MDKELNYVMRRMTITKITTTNTAITNPICLLLSTAGGDFSLPAGRNLSAHDFQGPGWGESRRAQEAAEREAPVITTFLSLS